MYSHYNTDGSNGSVIQGGCEGAEVRGFGVLGCGCGGLGRSGVVLGPYLNLQWEKRGGGWKKVIQIIKQIVTSQQVQPTGNTVYGLGLG